MMKRAVLFCNGAMENRLFHKGFLRKDDFIIAVDGGGKHCQTLELLPDLALGDFDSLTEELTNFYQSHQVEFMEYPADKNYIDLALAIDVALARGYSEIFILGALGGKRIDMELGNLLLLSRYHQHITIADENRSIFCLHKGEEAEMKHRAGEYLSLIPLTDALITTESRGLKYQLKDLHFSLGETRSISNEILEDSASFGLSEGKALVICQKR